MDVATLSAVVLAAASGSPVPGVLVDRLVAEGFENVALEARGDRDVLWVEDRRYLDGAEGLGVVARAIASTPGASGAIEVVSLSDRRAMLGTVMSRAALAEFFAGRLSPERFGETLVFDADPPAPPEPLANLSLGHVDLQTIPAYSFSAAALVWINGNVRVPLSAGWHALARVQAQVYPAQAIAPTFWTVGWHLPILPKVDLALRMGHWKDLENGFEAQSAGYLGDGRVLWSLRTTWVSQTSVASQPLPGLVGGLEVRYPFFDLYSRFGGGLYPKGDWAGYGTIGRLFGISEVEAGVYRSQNYGTQLRGTLSTYLGPRVRPAPGPLRWECPGQFDFFYMATAPQAASELYPEPQAGVIWRRLNPRYVREHLARWLR